MTRLLPEHPKGNSRVTQKQLQGIPRVSCGLLQGCLAVFLGRAARSQWLVHVHSVMDHISGAAGFADLAAIVVSLCGQFSCSMGIPFCQLGDSMDRL
jgi:hypothetical protein